MNQNKSTSGRLRLIIIFVIILLITLASLWLNMVIKKSAIPEISNKERSDPDYIVENFRYYKMAKTGLAQYEVKGTKLTHFPVEDSYMVDDPEMYSVNGLKQLQSVTAKQAYIEDFNTQIHLINNVVMNRRETVDGKPLTLLSPYVLINSDDEVMTSNEAVTIRNDRAILRGVGMRADNVTQELQLNSRVKVTYYPPSQKPPEILKKDQVAAEVPATEEQAATEVPATAEEQVKTTSETNQ